MKKAQSEGYLLIIVVYLFYVAKSEGETMLNKFKKIGIVNENDIMVYLEGLADNNHLVEKTSYLKLLVFIMALWSTRLEVKQLIDLEAFQIR